MTFKEYLKEKKGKANAETFEGSWDEIKNYIIQNYDKWEYIIFKVPDEKKTATVIPSKYGKKWWEKSTPKDIKRIMVY